MSQPNTPPQSPHVPITPIPQENLLFSTPPRRSVRIKNRTGHACLGCNEHTDDRISPTLGQSTNDVNSENEDIPELVDSSESDSDTETQVYIPNANIGVESEIHSLESGDKSVPNESVLKAVDSISELVDRNLTKIANQVQHTSSQSEDRLRHICETMDSNTSKFSSVMNRIDESHLNLTNSVQHSLSSMVNTMAKSVDEKFDSLSSIVANSVDSKLGSVTDVVAKSMNDKHDKLAEVMFA